MSGETKAAEFVLGLLDAKAHEDVVRAAADDKNLQAEISWWEAELSPLIASSATVERPNADTLARIMARIEAANASDAPALPGTVTLRAHDGVWEAREDLGRGVERRQLWRDAASGREAFLIRLAAGGSIRRHPHAADEECYLIEGDLSFGPLRLKAGDFHLARRGVDHPDATSLAGAVFMISTQHA